jgi:Skp family chaperone for outer membrane proteins
MNRVRWTALCVGAIGGTALFSATSGLLAQTPIRPGPTSIGCVDVRKLYDEYQRKKDLKDEVKEWQDRLERENQARRQRIDALVAALEVMDPNDPAALIRSRELIQIQVEYKNWADMMQAEMQREDGLWTARIYQEIVQAIEHVAKTQGLDLVVYRDEIQRTSDPQRLFEQILGRKVLYANPRVDISQAVIDKLNGDYRGQPRAPMLSVNAPVPSGPAAQPPRAPQ